MSRLDKFADDVEIRYIYNSSTNAKNSSLANARNNLGAASPKTKASYQGLLTKYTRSLILLLTEKLDFGYRGRVGLAFYATEEGVHVTECMGNSLESVAKDIKNIIPLDHGTAPRAIPYILEILDNPAKKRQNLDCYPKEGEAATVYILPSVESPVVLPGGAPPLITNASEYTARKEEKWARWHSVDEKWPPFVQLGNIEDSPFERTRRESEAKFKAIQDNMKMQNEKISKESAKRMENYIEFMEKISNATPEEVEKLTKEFQKQQLEQMRQMQQMLQEPQAQ